MAQDHANLGANLKNMRSARGLSLAEFSRELDISKTIRLPKECRFSGDGVLVNQIGDIVLLVPKNNHWAGFLSSLNLFAADFMQDGRAEETSQERESL